MHGHMNGKKYIVVFDCAYMIILLLFFYYYFIMYYLYHYFIFCVSTPK